MKLLKGFGKKYFTFCSIQAHSNAPKLHAILTISKAYLHNKLLGSSLDDNNEEEPPPNLEDSFFASFLNLKPCHCDGLFKRKTALAVSLFKFIPRCPYYNTFFAFRRTGVHPPLF
ncbi:MAG: hypothetical protein WC141_01785 [Arcobacteraceae bacterium]